MQCTTHIAIHCKHPEVNPAHKMPGERWTTIYFQAMFLTWKENLIWTSIEIVWFAFRNLYGTDYEHDHEDRPKSSLYLNIDIGIRLQDSTLVFQLLFPEKLKLWSFQLRSQNHSHLLAGKQHIMYTVLLKRSIYDCRFFDCFTERADREIFFFS